MAAGWTRATTEFSSIPGLDPAVDPAVNPSVDPALDWALGVGRIYFFLKTQRKWMPILVQLKGISVGDFASGKRFLKSSDDAAEWEKSVRVRWLYTQAPFAGTKDQFCTALVTHDFFDLLRAHKKEALKYIARITLGLPLDRDSLPPSESGAQA